MIGEHAMAEALLGAASFEKRSMFWLDEFLNEGGNPKSVFVANVVEDVPAHMKNVDDMTALGVSNIRKVNRFSSEDLWSWVIDAVSRVAHVGQSVMIDATCMPRELLGMLLFALAVRRGSLNRISVGYVSAPEGGYATQNERLPESSRWLSKGVDSVRSIVGYPGVFHSEKPCHLVVLAGHEQARTLRLVEYMEPARLTISGESEMGSVVAGAGSISRAVASALKQRVPVPTIGDIEFSSSSIEAVYQSLFDAHFLNANENVALAAMNTKLSFIGAALFALSNRSVRMMYAVPKEYNPLYCEGVGDPSYFDITWMIHEADVVEAIP